jgi:ubiquinone/menaquinone biosynthesis C-methylase UbiE
VSDNAAPNAAHWESVYRTKDSNSVSWFRARLDVSLRLLKQAGANQYSRIIDVGAGASTLIDDLLALGVQRITALDLSAASLEITKRRLGARGTAVNWMVGDAARVELEPNSFDYWHDRAVLHFLVDPVDVAAYVHTAERSIIAGGHAVIGCFASDGPEKCSGLPVVRREADEIAQLFAPKFELVQAAREQHLTPSGTSQSFAYVLLKKST